MAISLRTFFGLRSKLATFKSLTWRERRTYYPPRIRRGLGAYIRMPVQLLYLPAALIFNRSGRRIAVWTSFGPPRIGHLAGEPHWFIKAQLMGVVPRYKNIMLAPRATIANNSLLDHWRPYFIVVQNPALIALLTPLSWIRASRVMMTFKEASITWEDGRQQYGTAAMEEVHERYSDVHGSSLFMTLGPELEKQGRGVLEALGVPRDAWFVTLHVREHGYLRDSRHDHRDCDVMDFLQAAARIHERGGWVVRIGDRSMRPLPEQPGLVDYLFSDRRSDWMDIYLLARNRFFLGSDSGPAFVPPLFGIAAAIVGAVPMGHGSFWRDDIYLPKLHQDKNSGRILSFPEILASPLRDLHTTDQVAEAGIVTLDNSPEEIVELVDEMMDRCDSQIVYTDSDEEFQLIWWQLMATNATAHTNGTRGRVGNQFARRNRSLLMEQSS
jgi:putative glycosyltransferase (TIGR04372 family)